MENKKSQIWEVISSSEFSDRVNNPIRNIVEKIKMSTNMNKELIPLSLGDPTVFKNLQCPDVLTDSIVRNLRNYENNGYLHSAGSEKAREAIAIKYSSTNSPLTKDDVIITSGCSGALDIAISGLLNKDDIILLPEPGFSLYNVIAKAHQIKVKFYKLLPEKNWEIDLNHLESMIDNKTKAILINNPSNPCGSVYSKEHLENLLQLAESYHLPIISDEIYQDMTFNTNIFYPLASIPSSLPTISVGGIAKSFIVPGWRIGWILIHDKNNILLNVKNGYFKISQLILGACSLIQSSLPDILTPVNGSKEEISLNNFKLNYYKTLENNYKSIKNKLNESNGLKMIQPQGTMYAMIKLDLNILKGIKDDVDFTQKLLNEESVFVLPGSCFGIKNYIRIVFAAPEEKLMEAFDRINIFSLRWANL